MIEIKKQEFTKPLIIAGPCSAESQDQLLATAKGLEDKATIFRAGVWKPRTRPNSFEGVGQKALEWLKVVKQETSLKSSYRSCKCSACGSMFKRGYRCIVARGKDYSKPFLCSRNSRGFKRC